VKLSPEKACMKVQELRSRLATLAELPAEQMAYTQPHFISTLLIENVLMGFLPVEMQEDVQALLHCLREQFVPMWKGERSK